MNDDAAEILTREVPDDPQGPRRRALWAERGIRLHAVRELDEFAHDLRKDTETQAGFVNLIDHTGQFFAGMATKSGPRIRTDLASDPNAGRWWPRDKGFCPYVVEKGSALTLRDARASRKYGAGNPVIREHGYITYTGVPVRAPAGVPEEGEIIGTLCVTDLGPRNWVMADVEEMHERAAALARLMYELGASQL